MNVHFLGRDLGSLPDGTVIYKIAEEAPDETRLQKVRWARMSDGRWAHITCNGIEHTHNTWNVAVRLGRFIPDLEMNQESWEVTFD